MSREITNELEERRVIRLLAGAAETVSPLNELEAAALVRATAVQARIRGARRYAFPLRPQLLSAAALAAVVAIVAILPLRDHEAEQRSGSQPARVEAQLAAFPEGSALTLLLSRPVQKHA